MALVDVNGVNIYWRESGEGEPLLLIMGLGYSSDMWHRVEPRLAQHYRVIVMDNRGTGESDTPHGAYPIETMAKDAVAVLDAAGVERAHVFGVSMGGYIAQTLALDFPERVNMLILGSTVTGGEKVVMATDEVMALVNARREMTPEEGVWALVPYIYSKSTTEDMIEQDIAIRLSSYPPAQGYAGQLDGIQAWSVVDRLSELQAPTLVIHGDEDQLIPLENAYQVADAILNARLEIIKQASHIFFTDQCEETCRLVIDFLG